MSAAPTHHVQCEEVVRLLIKWGRVPLALQHVGSRTNDRSNGWMTPGGASFALGAWAFFGLMLTGGEHRRLGCCDLSRCDFGAIARYCCRKVPEGAKLCYDYNGFRRSGYPTEHFT
jgi:hypothetical protein